MMLRPLVSVPAIAGNRAMQPGRVADLHRQIGKFGRVSGQGIGARSGRGHQLGYGVVLGIEFVSETG